MTTTTDRQARRPRVRHHVAHNAFPWRRIHEVTFPAPPTAARCAARGHTVGGAWWVECSRCGDRPLWFGSMNEINGRPAAGWSDGGYGEYRSWRTFRDHEHYAAHVAAGRPVAWPADVARHGGPGAADHAPTETVRVTAETISGDGWTFGIAARVTAETDASPLQLTVQAGRYALTISTDRAGRTLARAITGRARAHAATNPGRTRGR